MSVVCLHETAATGEWGRVVWASEATGQRPALEFFEQLSEKEAAKVQALFERLAEHGQIKNNEQFKKLGDRQGHAILEFKSYQLRFLGAFTSGRRFLVAHGLRKKKNKLRPADLDRAARILTEHMAQDREGRGGSR